jgi:hypothetical protein
MGMALPTQYEEALVNAVRWRNFADAAKVLKRVCALSNESARMWLRLLRPLNCCAQEGT